MTMATNLYSRAGLFPQGGAIPPIPTPLDERKAIHISDLNQYCTCRRAWGWSSPLRRGLQPGVLPEPLQLGQAVHLAMEAGYRDSIGAKCMHLDELAALDAFYNFMEERRQQIISYSGPMWEDEQESFDKMCTMGATVIKHYAMMIKPRDPHYKLLSSERLFRVPIPGTDKICYEGRFDGVVEDARGRKFILEFKTARSLKTTEGTFRGIQATMYVWAARQVYDANITGVLYRVMRKKIPNIPYLTKNGQFSRAKTQKMTMPWARLCLKQMANMEARKSFEAEGIYATTREEIKALRDNILKDYTKAAAGLLAMIQGRDSEAEFFMHREIPRKGTQCESAVHAVTCLGREMIDSSTPTFPVTGIHCSWCQFRDPCDLAEAGMGEAALAVLDAEYARRDYWDEQWAKVQDRTEAPDIPLLTATAE